MDNLQTVLNIPPGRLDAINAVFSDANMTVMKEFLDVVAKYGTPEEINRKHRQNRTQEALFAKVRERAPQYIPDLEWLIAQRERGAFVSVADYRRSVLGARADAMSFKDDSAVTLEVSALQYFPWIRAMCEKAISER